ncbi:RNA-binding transcriptional accessory protein [Corallincola luteus]|uniref:RNA-binding transcriptional accessory protein n=1 Tax=Corallincola luteus TaxID=1775177 RepID=A0ABY2AJB7_9GAMM|nr:Tex family protein [Corallincola luteus]TCI01424.1 RNA-binding transcriptional accessory protein [Corallincola luteus]
MLNINRTIADELSVKEIQVTAAVDLLNEGSTVPFIARYRKEATGGLDDTQLRTLEQRLGYLRELEQRRAAILTAIEEQGKLTASLTGEINAADTKTRLEELYLPYKQKRRTKGQIAIEAGLQALADKLLADPTLTPETEALAFINGDKGIADTKGALDGARYILMERFAENANLLQTIREYMWHNAVLTSQVVTGQEQAGAKFSDYFDHTELLKNVPSHRALAMFRGRNEGVLQLNLDADPGQEEKSATSHCESLIANQFEIRFQDRAADRWLKQVVQWTWKIKIALYMETELLSRVREAAEEEAIKVFANNLKDLLMAAPAGRKVTLGLDPGLRTGVKVAVVDSTGKLLATDTIYPHAPRNQWQASLKTLSQLCSQHGVELIAVGNGTASRETDKLAGELIAMSSGQRLQKVMVSEAGASVYSASEFAAREFPGLDVSLRGAVSIARRLQDPLAELVKIEPKSIGVGQYQHDVSQNQLAKGLDAVVEDCVNGVGVDINTASAPLLTRVSGLNGTLAANIVAYRDNEGEIRNRKQLLKVPRLGPKAFEQCAGFLRINGGDNPLDASSVHPEAYPLVEKILKRVNAPITSVMGDTGKLRQLDPVLFADEGFGLPTVKDILKELEKPGRDPRPAFTTAAFQEGVETLADLKPGMTLEGVVTNVANFGAFVDIGVHQDGLVHISHLADKFISDPRDVVKAGQVVKVKVLEVDAPRKRISLSMRMDAEITQSNDNKGKPQAARRQSSQQTKPRSTKQGTASQPNANVNSAFADAFAKAKRR